MSSIRMEIKYPEPPIGQQFLLRAYLERLFTDARFEGEAWRSCVAAFLATPGVPLLAQNATCGMHLSRRRRVGGVIT